MSEEQKTIEQVGYQEFYRYFQEKTTLIEQQRKEIEKLHSIIKEVREKVDNYDVFKEFTFPLMKRWEEEQVKSSIDYEWRESVKEPILEILDKENK